MKISGILNFKIFAATLAAKNGETSQIWIFCSKFDMWSALIKRSVILSSKFSRRLWWRKTEKITHMDIKIQLFGRFCTNFDMLRTLMKGSGILKIEILVVTLAAKWQRFTCMAIKTELLCRKAQILISDRH